MVGCVPAVSSHSRKGPQRSFILFYKRCPPSPLPEIPHTIMWGSRFSAHEFGGRREGGTEPLSVAHALLFLALNLFCARTVAMLCGPTPDTWLSSSPFVLHLAPSPPIIKSKEIQSCEEAALICWESGNLNPVDSYTVELTQAETPEPSGVTE